MPLPPRPNSLSPGSPLAHLDLLLLGAAYAPPLPHAGKTRTSILIHETPRGLHKNASHGVVLSIGPPVPHAASNPPPALRLYRPCMPLVTTSPTMPPRPPRQTNLRFLAANATDKKILARRYRTPTNPQAIVSSSGAGSSFKEKPHLPIAVVNHPHSPTLRAPSLDLPVSLMLHHNPTTQE